MSNFDANITLNAKDNASPVVDQATKNILANWKVMRQEVKATRAEFELQNQTLVAGSEAFRSIGSVASSAMNIFQQYQTTQIRGIDAQNRLILAQMHYNQVLAEQGPGSNEAIAANIELQDAQRGVATAAQDATIGYIGMGLELAGTVSQIISAIPKVQNFARILGGIKNLKPGTITAGEEATSAVTSTATSVLTGAATAGGGGIAGLAAKLGTSALRVAPAAAGVGIAVELLSMMGRQQAGGGEEKGIATGTDALSEIAGDISHVLPAAVEHGFERLSNLLQGRGWTRDATTPKVELAVTITPANQTDHRITVTEKSMGVHQVYGPGG